MDDRCAEFIGLSKTPVFDSRACDSSQSNEETSQLILTQRMLALTAQSPTYSLDLELKRLSRMPLCHWPSLPARLRESLDAAHRRRKLMRELNLAALNPSPAGEQSLIDGAQQLPAEYHPNLARRVRLAAQRVAIWIAFEAAAVEPVVERELAAAWANMRALNFQRGVAPERQARAELAERRTKLLDQLTLLRECTPDERRRWILELWDESLLALCGEAQVWRGEWERAHRQVEWITRLRNAIEQQNASTARRLLKEIALSPTVSPDELADELKTLKSEAMRLDANERASFLQSVVEGDGVRFAELFDGGLVADMLTEYPHHRRKACRLMEMQLLSGTACASAKPSRGEFQVNETGGRIVRWTAPATRIAARSLFGLSAVTLKQTSLPDDVVLLYRTIVECGDAAGGTVVGLPASVPSDGGFAYVWVIVDIGDDEVFYSIPWEICRFPSASRR